MVLRAWLAVVLLAGVAHAGPLDPAGGSPRAIGRAGASAVADDGGGALQINPAGIARRDTWRIQLGVGLVDDGIAWQPKNAPIARDQGGTNVLPIVAVVGSFGSWIIGAGMMTSGASDRALRDPSDVSADDVVKAGQTRRFEYRYTGIEGGLRRDTFVLGAARRVTDTVAIGLSTGLSRISAHEMRRMWVGFESASGGVGDPTRDLQLALDGDAIVPHATLGTLIAPEDSPMELGLSIGWIKRPRLSGSLQGISVNDPMGEAPDLDLRNAEAALIVRQPIAIHAGARYIGDRFTVEVGGDLWLASEKARKVAWELRGVRVIDNSQVATELDGVPSRYSLRSHGAIRVAGDVEVISGFLWATAGYAFTIGGTTEARLSPTFGDLGGHTIALGIEGTAGGVTYTIGWSRTLSKVRSRESELRLDNPFAAGDAFVPDGSYDASSDQVGVLLDLELDAP